MISSNEIWQTEVNGQIYETSFEELTQWIAEGVILPQDKVRRKNLRWIEANKVPTLYGFFNAKEMGLAPPIMTTTINQKGLEAPQVQTFSLNSLQPTPQSFSQPPPPQFYQELAPPVKTHFCSIHPSSEATLYCETCLNYFCRICPNQNACPMCGATCKSLEPPVIQPPVFTPLSNAQPLQANLIDPEVRKGANWFYWKAALTVINSIIILTGTIWTFFLGLGITQIIQGFAIGIADEMGTKGISGVHLIAFVISLFCAGFVGLLGYFAGHGQKWAYIFGLVIFILDGFLYLITGSILGVIIHGIGIYSLANGLKACQK